MLVAKGAQDTVCSGHGDVLSTVSSGSPRRCGGQGDVLSGTLASCVSWAVSHSQAKVRTRRREAVWLALFCTVHLG